MPPQDQLTALETAFADWRAQRLPLAGFVAVAHQQSALTAALPPAFGTVLSDLLNRLESSALFDEESCSFSQRDLADSLALWLSKARARLEG